MRTRDLAIFFTVVFIIYAGANVFLYFKWADAFRSYSPGPDVAS